MPSPDKAHYPRKVLTVRLLFHSGGVMTGWQREDQTEDEFRAIVDEISRDMRRLHPNDPPPLMEWEYTDGG